jgi:hypothetical protein
MRHVGVLTCGNHVLYSTSNICVCVWTRILKKVKNLSDLFYLASTFVTLPKLAIITFH